MAYITIETELEAINIAVDLWAFLKSTGEDKDSYMHGIEKRWLAGCPLCQFYVEQDDKDIEIMDKSNEDQYYRSGCKKCPLFKKTLCRFAHPESAFREWQRTSDKVLKMHYAKIIHAAILKRKMKLEVTDVTPIRA